MSDPDIFNKEEKEIPEGTPPAQNDPFADQLSLIKNEQGETKYKDVGTALEALSTSQQFIETLKAENATKDQELQTARDEIAKIGNIQDFVDKISPNSSAQPKVETPTSVDGMSEEKVVDVVNQLLRTQENEHQAQINLAGVINKLSEVHGDKAASFIKTRAEELNTTAQELKKIAQTNPSMALSLLGGSIKPNSAPSQSSIIPSHQPSDDNPLPVFEKGVARGGQTNKEVMDMWEKSKAYTRKRLNVEG